MIRIDSANEEVILVIDFGSQYSRLIARRVRESNVYCEIVQYDTPWEAISHLNPKGIILSGGPASVYDSDAPMAPSWVYELKIPILGICYGLQVLAHQLGGKVIPGTIREYGNAVLYQQSESIPIFSGLSKTLNVWMSHGDQVLELPEGFDSLAYTQNSDVAVMGNNAGIIGLQFHPEVVHTPDGNKIIRNFLFEICNVN